VESIAGTAFKDTPVVIAAECGSVGCTWAIKYKYERKITNHKPEDIVGYDIVMVKGGRVETLDFLPGFSTTAIEQKIAKGE
jgi:bifunctional ADP-heptose synthase (sugar kinase/adenylyltransferase)